MPGFTKVENRILKKYISDPQLSKSLVLIRGVMESIWANDSPKIVQNYTDHGEEHSVRVAGFVEKLLRVNPSAKFSQQEIYLLLAGVYLHDIGMQCDIVKYPEIKEKAKSLGANFNEAFTAKTTNGYSLGEQKEIRDNHHYLSAAWIDYMYEENDSVLSSEIRSIPYDLVNDLMDVCKFHSKLRINDCSDLFNDYPNSRKKMVAALLRFADELDISSTRVNIKTVKIFSIDSENSIYWWLHNYTKIDFVNSNIIHLKVNLHPQDFKLYGSLIRKEYITNFKNKNHPVLDVLVGQKIPIIIDDNSDIVPHNRADKFPPEITQVFDIRINDVKANAIDEIEGIYDSIYGAHIDRFRAEIELLTHEVVKWIDDTYVLKSNLKICLLIDSGTTTYYLFKEISNTLNSDKNKKKIWNERVCIVTNNLSGSQYLIINSIKDTDNKYLDTAIPCFLLPTENLSAHLTIVSDKSDKWILEKIEDDNSERSKMQEFLEKIWKCGSDDYIEDYILF